MIDERFVILGAILNLIGTSTYVRDTIKGRIRPNRISWFLWALAPLVAFSAEIGQGVGLSSIMTFVVGFSPLCVFISSFLNKKAYWKIARLDIFCGVISILGLILWYVTKVGNIAIVFGIISDAAAGIPTLIKSFYEPESENYILFTLGGMNGFITLLTIKEWNFAHYGFPLYIFLICVVFVVLIRFKLGKVISKRIR